MRDDPAFPLEAVHSAAREDRILLEGARCRDMLLPRLDTYVRCLEFARDFALELTENAFSHTVQQVDPCDVYGLELPEALAAAFVLPAGEVWYAKLTLEEGDDGMLVFVSLHPAERDLPTRGGVLRIVRPR